MNGNSGQAGGELSCDLCGKPARMVGPFIEMSPRPPKTERHLVCGLCLQMGWAAIQSQQKKNPEAPKEIRIPSPTEVVDHLNQYIIGQEQAKITMAVAVVNHYKRLAAIGVENDNPFGDVELS